VATALPDRHGASADRVRLRVDGLGGCPDAVLHDAVDDLPVTGPSRVPAEPAQFVGPATKTLPSVPMGTVLFWVARRLVVRSSAVTQGEREWVAVIPTSKAGPGSELWPISRGLVRARLLDRVREPAHLTLVVAPAGWGKTTFLAQLASATPGPTAWLRTDRADTSRCGFATSLARALADAGVLARPDDLALPGNADGIVEFLNTLQPRGQHGIRLVVDDAHVLLNCPAEQMIEQILLHSPALSLVLASRRAPNLNLNRAEIGPVTMVSADDLRFRTWEVERLFRDVYRVPLPPDDIAVLTRRVDGWAACLQLFHLSTQSGSLGDRRRAVRALAGGARFARTFLARTVLGELPQRLGAFLTHTCMFEVLTADRCNVLLRIDDSQRLLEDLERLETLTTSDDDGRTFRCHEVLRRHLEGALLEELGPTRARECYRTAGRLLEDRGCVSEAVRAYLRAECWDEARRALQSGGEQVIKVDRGNGWQDLLSARLADEDPWLSMVLARQLALDGRLAAAIERYQIAADLFPAAADRERAARAKRLVELWFGGRPQRHLHWADRLRHAVHRSPGAVMAAPTVPGVGDQLCQAVASLLTGNPASAHTALHPLSDDPDADGWLALAVRLVEAVAELVSGQVDARVAERLAADAERVGASWFARQARVVSAIQVDEPDSIQRVWNECNAVDDQWGGLLAGAAAAIHQFLADQPSLPAFQSLAKQCRALGAGTLEVWSFTFAALAAVAEGHPEAGKMARGAESLARARGVWGAQALTAIGLAVADPAQRGIHTSQARSLAKTHGLPWPTTLVQRLARAGQSVSYELTPSAPRATVTEAAPMIVRCFGGFALDFAGCTLDWSRLRPRAATMLRLLASEMPQHVHRDVLLSLWPDLPTDRGLRSLQVAVSSLRSFLTLDELRDLGPGVSRQGEAYRLVVPPGAEVDVLVFAAGLQDADRARRAGHDDVERAALGRAVTVYVGDLLPEDGAAEWVVSTRERYRGQAAGAAGRLAALATSCGDLPSAIDAATRSLAIDPYRDGSWRLLIDTHLRVGDRAAAARARRQYAEVLEDLGVSAQPQVTAAVCRPARPHAPAQRREQHP
jgi:DNA-binding SARP family transcriptional activator/tetratricopeptide (TPR) repeat protein